MGVAVEGVGVKAGCRHRGALLEQAAQEPHAAQQRLHLVFKVTRYTGKQKTRDRVRNN